jgi:hypothetical protein
MYLVLLKPKEKKHIRIILFMLIIANNCLCQNIRKKIEIKLDTLYPKARITGWYGSKNKNEDVLLNCNCPEFYGEMQLTFDTNASILTKTYYFWSLKDLPDSVLSHIKMNISKTVRFDTGYFEKHVNCKGEASYLLRTFENGSWFDVSFKNSGEIISKKKEPELRE